MLALFSLFWPSATRNSQKKVGIVKVHYIFLYKASYVILFFLYIKLLNIPFFRHCPRKEMTLPP